MGHIMASPSYCVDLESEGPSCLGVILDHVLFYLYKSVQNETKMRKERKEKLGKRKQRKKVGQSIHIIVEHLTNRKSQLAGLSTPSGKTWWFPSLIVHKL